MAPEIPKTEKGQDVKKPEMDPSKPTPDKVETEPNWGIPETNHLPYEDQPSPASNSKQKSGAV